MRRHRKRIGEGIYEDEFGIAAAVKAKGRQQEKRFPVGTSLNFIQAWRQSTREAILQDADRVYDDTIPAAHGTFADDLTRYLTTIQGRVSYKADRAHLRAWLPLIGTQQRRRVRSARVKAAIQIWREAKVSPATIRHRVRVLRELYRGLDGPHAVTPTQGVTVPTPAAPHPVAVPWKTVQAVAASLKHGFRGEKAHGPQHTIAEYVTATPEKTRARFLVLATTGQRPAQVMRAVRTDLDFRRRIWFVRSAKGGTPIALPLDEQMIAAWRAFIAADAFGPYDGRSFAKVLRRHGWPQGLRPYELRHTLAIDMLLGGADLSDVQGALGHRQIETTRRYYAHLQLARQRRALQLKRRGRLA